MTSHTLNFNVPRMESSTEECKGCHLCVHACPENAIEIAEELNSRGFHFVRYKGENCTGCGICFYACPEPGAITVYKKGYKESL